MSFDFDLNLLVCFKIVAEQGSLSKAASKLCITQPAVSMQIKKLEQQLKEKLFDRHNRGLILTPIGESLLAQVQEMSSLLDNMFENIQSFQNKVEGSLHVGTYTTISSYLLPPIIKQYLEKFPKVKIIYHYENTEDILDKIIKYQLDCAILCNIPNDPRFDIIPFYYDRLILVTAASNTDVPERMAIKDLANIEFLSYPIRFDYCYQEIEKRYGKYLKKASIPIETMSISWDRSDVYAAVYC